LPAEGEPERQPVRVVAPVPLWLVLVCPAADVSDCGVLPGVALFGLALFCVVLLCDVVLCVVLL
jgi:hypothetical protein